MTTKRCIKCQLAKPVTEFYKHRTNLTGVSGMCRSCSQFYNGQKIQRGLKILQDLATARTCCAHCQRPYSNEDWHFFEFDHIDPNQKQSRKETESKWVDIHQHEFFKRVAPNLQLLCVKCHKIKTSQEMKLGGAIHQKINGQSRPVQSLDPGWNLFRPIPVGRSDELRFQYQALLKEGQWVTVRDIDGNLISYEPYSKYLKSN